MRNASHAGATGASVGDGVRVCVALGERETSDGDAVSVPEPVLDAVPVLLGTAPRVRLPVADAVAGGDAVMLADAVSEVDTVGVAVTVALAESVAEADTVADADTVAVALVVSV